MPRPPEPRARHRRRRRALLGVLAAVGLAVLWGWATMIRMPGQRLDGPLPPLTQEQSALRDELHRHVQVLATEIGERNTRHYDSLARAADYIEEVFADAGYEVTRQSYELGGQRFHNVEVELRGAARDREIVVVGAHYDSALGTPGANDNGTGVAALLALASRFSGREPARTVRFVAFTNEEMPHFRDGTMGSGHYARRCVSRGDRVTAMLSLETMGYYSDEPGSQQYPFPVGLFYPDRGNFIGVVGNVTSRALVREVVQALRRHTRFPVEGAALPSWVPGVGWSDHASFWEVGYPAVMLTDTAPFRYPYYHHPGDTPDKVDFERLARVVGGLPQVVETLARTSAGFGP